MCMHMQPTKFEGGEFLLLALCRKNSSNIDKVDGCGYKGQQKMLFVSDACGLCWMIRNTLSQFSLILTVCLQVFSRNFSKRGKID